MLNNPPSPYFFNHQSIMEKFFRRLGDKKNLPNDAEKEAAREAFQVLKDRNKGRTRFFKPEARHKSNSYIEVDEATALLSEYSYLRSNIDLSFCLCNKSTKC